MWSRQWMMRLIIYYVQLDTQDIHDKNVYIICTDKTILKTLY